MIIKCLTSILLALEPISLASAFFMKDFVPQDHKREITVSVSDPRPTSTYGTQVFEALTGPYLPFTIVVATVVTLLVILLLKGFKLCFKCCCRCFYRARNCAHAEPNDDEASIPLQELYNPLLNLISRHAILTPRPVIDQQEQANFHSLRQPRSFNRPFYVVPIHSISPQCPNELFE